VVSLKQYQVQAYLNSTKTNCNACSYIIHCAIVSCSWSICLYWKAKNPQKNSTSHQCKLWLFCQWDRVD